MSTPVDRQTRLIKDFKEVMSHWASGVTVVTTAGPTGRPHGFTASSFTVVSLDPPTVLVCLDRAADCAPAFAAAEWLAVHILGAGQRDMAGRFARKSPDKFAGLATEPGRSGTPLLPDAVATLECRTVRRLPVGDHLVLFAEVHDARTAGEEEPAGDRPLLYHRRAFHALGHGA
ncbi:flavin reductase family protein [Streptomyces tricolor]|uniref:Flavin reductase family protein n=1 Tax=Streptomyces tricolor TaxID=68277 RepID=A0ABS9JNM2_9ACTN|nr:flavin reductase family protein [Streptomyces tricolor]MCG0067081.1 flavin reductase family protein [Streptomyces tricolor]